MPLSTIASATLLIRSSVMSVPYRHQEFQPIGGAGASVAPSYVPTVYSGADAGTNFASPQPPHNRYNGSTLLAEQEGRFAPTKPPRPPRRSTRYSWPVTTPAHGQPSFHIPFSTSPGFLSHRAPWPCSSRRRSSGIAHPCKQTTTSPRHGAHRSRQPGRPAARRP